MSCDWKTAYKKNRVNIVKGLANPDEVAGLLFQSEILNDEMHETVKQIDEIEQKTRKILDLLNYRGKNGLAALHQAFLDTSNKELAKGLAPYVLAVEEGDNKTEPKEWPPSVYQEKVMLNDPVIKIKDTKSPLFIHEYGQEYVYTIQSERRGKVFIINNVNFKGPMQDRPASIMDAENLTKLFEELHFTVLRKDDLTSQDMKSFLCEEAKQLDKENCAECAILIIMSHGSGTKVYGVDCLPVELKSLTDCFSSENCKSLHGKPRLVFVQACRSYDKSDVTEKFKQMTTEPHDEMDAEPSKIEVKENKSPKCTFPDHPSADFLIAYATPEGTKAWLHNDVGSWFMNAIVWTFKYHAHEEELHHLLIRVNRLVGKGSTLKKEMTVAEVKSNLRKKFFFFPGIHSKIPTLF